MAEKNSDVRTPPYTHQNPGWENALAQVSEDGGGMHHSAAACLSQATGRGIRITGKTPCANADHDAEEGERVVADLGGGPMKLDMVVEGPDCWGDNWCPSARAKQYRAEQPDDDGIFMIGGRGHRVGARPLERRRESSGNDSGNTAKRSAVRVSNASAPAAEETRRGGPKLPSKKSPRFRGPR